MEVLLESDSNLNKANYYERRAEVALKNMSKYIRLVEKNYTDAVACLRNAIGFLESAQDELPEVDDERSICDLRLSELHRRLEIMRPYRFLKSCHFDDKGTLGAAALTTAFPDRKLSVPTLSLRPTNGPGVADWDPDHSDWTFCRNLPTGAADAAACLAKKYPKSQDQLLEESTVRIRELTKMVDDLSEQLNEAMKRVADERSQRLNIQAELMACQLDYRTSLSNSMYAGYSTSTRYTPCNSMTQSFSLSTLPSEVNLGDLPSTNQPHLPIALPSTPS